MVVDAMMQIPWLAAIVNACIWVGKAVWDLVGKAARTVALWFSTAIPIIVRWVRERVVLRLAFLAMIFGLVTVFWQAVLNLSGQVVSLVVPSAGLSDMLGPFAGYVWDAPMHLGYGFEKAKTLFALHMSARSIRGISVALGWAWRVKQP